MFLKKKISFFRKVQLENENIINQTVNPTNNEGTKGEPEQQLTSMIYNLWRKTKRGGIYNNSKRGMVFFKIILLLHTIFFLIHIS